MGEVGILAPDARVELLDGQIHDTLPVGPFHCGVGTRLQSIFSGVAAGRWRVRVQYPVHLNSGSEPVPDLALVKPRADYYAKKRPRPAEVFLLVEVAQSSLPFDRKEKLMAYALAGITEYWIVNLKAKSVEVLRGPLPIGEYSQTTRHKKGDTVSPAAFPDLQIAVADVF